MCRTGPSLPCICVLPSKKWWFLVLSIFSFFPIAQIVVGSLYRRKCAEGFYLSLWNLVSGILLLCAVTMEMVYSAIMRIRVPKRSTYPLEQPTQNVMRHTVTPRRVIFYPLMVIVFQISIAISSGFGLYLIFDVSCQKFFDIFTMIAVYIHLFGVIVVPAFCCVSYIWFRNEESDDDDIELRIDSSFSEKKTYPTYPPRNNIRVNFGVGTDAEQSSALQEKDKIPYGQHADNLTYMRPSCLEGSGARPGRSLSLGSRGEFLGMNPNSNSIHADDNGSTTPKHPSQTPPKLIKAWSKSDAAQKPAMQRVALSGSRMYENIERRNANTARSKSEFIHVRTADNKSIRFNLPESYGTSFPESRNRIPVTSYHTGIFKDGNVSLLPVPSTGGSNYRSVSPLNRKSPIEGRVKSLPVHRNFEDTAHAGTSVKREPLLSTFENSTNRSEDDFFQLKTDAELQSNV